MPVTAEDSLSVTEADKSVEKKEESYQYDDDEFEEEDEEEATTVGSEGVLEKVTQDKIHWKKRRRNLLLGLPQESKSLIHQAHSINMPRQWLIL